MTTWNPGEALGVKHRLDHNALDELQELIAGGGLPEIRYVKPTGNDANDGSSWGKAKQTILAAYDSLPSTGGTIRIANNSNVGGEVANQGIWLVGPNDVNYASPPAGWRQQKNVRFIGEPAGASIQFSKPSATFKGGTTTFNYDGTTKPAIWLAGTTASLVFEDLNAFYVSVGLRAGVGTDNDRSVNTSMVQCRNLCFASYNVGVTKTDPGNMIDIGYLFWGWFEQCAWHSYAPASRDSDARACVLVKPDPTGEAAGLIYFRDIITGSGGLKYYKGNTSWHVDVENWLHEGDFTSGEPATVDLVDVNGSGFATLRDVSRADINPATSEPHTIKVGPNAGASKILVLGGDGTVSGPHTMLHGYNVRTDLALQHAAGLSNGSGRTIGARLVAQHDGAARQFGPVAVRATNLAAQDVTTWSSKQGTATVTTGQTAPDGTTNAAKLSAAVLDNRQVYRAVRTFAVGDWVIGGVWMKPSADGGVGGSPGAVMVGTNPTNYIAFDENSAGSYFGGETDGEAGKWDWKVFASKVASVTTPNPELILSLQCSNGHDMTYYAPMLLHIPAGTMTDDEVMEMVYHLNPWPEATAAGYIATLKGQKLISQSGVGPNPATLWTYLGAGPERMLGSDIAVPSIWPVGNGVGDLGKSGGQTYWRGVYLSDKLWFGQGGVAEDTNLYRSAANILKTDDSLVVAGSFLDMGAAGSFVQLLENAAAEPAAGAANTARLFVKDNGAGKTQLCVKFATGVAQVIAEEV